MSAPGFAAVVVASVLASVGCASAAKHETRALAEAVDRYRHATAAAKAVDGQAVTTLGCTDARVCATKEACVAAIEPTTRALELKDEVTRGLADIEQKRLAADSIEAHALPDKLDEAETLFKEGRARMAECDAKLAELQLTVGG